MENRVQSQPHGSEPLSPPNEKRKRENPKVPRKKEKRETLHPRKKEPKRPTYTPGKPPSPNQTEQKNPKNHKTKNLRTKEPKHPKHPRPDQQPSPDTLCTDPNKTKQNPQPLSTKNQRISHYSLLVRRPPVSPCSELVVHRPSGSHSD